MNIKCKLQPKLLHLLACNDVHFTLGQRFQTMQGTGAETYHMNGLQDMAAIANLSRQDTVCSYHSYVGLAAFDLSSHFAQQDIQNFFLAEEKLALRWCLLSGGVHFWLHTCL